MKVITITELNQIIAKHGFRAFIRDLIQHLREDFSRWEAFHKIPRIPAHVPNGVIELMPIWDDRYYAYKYVNGHPNNPKTGHLNVVAFGALADIATGYPLILSEMTLLTGIRTAASSAMASDLLARKDVATFSIIGCGAQSEFQTIAHLAVRPIRTVKFFDLDPKAMERFARNLQGVGVDLAPCKSAEETVADSYLVTTATASPGHREVLPDRYVKAGMHINGIGGDSPGKTELPIATLKRAKIFVEFFPQTEVEGEIQLLTPHERAAHVRAEIWEVLTGRKKGRESDQDLTLYDSVGFALEDYSVLRLVRELAERYKMGLSLPLLPELADPKNLISALGTIK